MTLERDVSPLTMSCYLDRHLKVACHYSLFKWLSFCSSIVIPGNRAETSYKPTYREWVVTAWFGYWYMVLRCYVQPGRTRKWCTKYDLPARNFLFSPQANRNVNETVSWHQIWFSRALFCNCCPLNSASVFEVAQQFPRELQCIWFLEYLEESNSKIKVLFNRFYECFYFFHQTMEAACSALFRRNRHKCFYLYCLMIAAKIIWPDVKGLSLWLIWSKDTSDSMDIMGFAKSSEGEKVLFVAVCLFFKAFIYNRNNDSKDHSISKYRSAGNKIL